MNRYLVILIVLFPCLLFSCRNSYEDKLVGKYRIADFSPDSLQDKSSFTLDLLKDNSFILNFRQTKLQGKWHAGDDGDRTWLRFFFTNGSTSDAQVGGDNYEIIMIWNPRDLLLPQLQKLTLNRVKN